MFMRANDEWMCQENYAAYAEIYAERIFSSRFIVNFSQTECDGNLYKFEDGTSISITGNLKGDWKMMNVFRHCLC